MSAEAWRSPRDRYLIWSFEHDMWWKGDHRGYTKCAGEAGHYTRQQAEDIVTAANWKPGVLNETFIPLHAIA